MFALIADWGGFSNGCTTFPSQLKCFDLALMRFLHSRGSRELRRPELSPYQTGDPSIRLPPLFHRQTKVFQISSSSVMFSSSCLMRRMRYLIPVAGSGVYPEVSSLPGRCSANFLLRWLKPPQRRTTPLLRRFSTNQMLWLLCQLPFYHNSPTRHTHYPHLLLFA